MAATARFRDFARRSLSRYGLYTSDRMANFCEDVIQVENFEDLTIPLAVTATDVRTGDAVVFTKGALADPMRASCAYPGMFPPVEADGRSLIDGMLAYAVPTTYCSIASSTVCLVMLFFSSQVATGTGAAPRARVPIQQRGYTRGRGCTATPSLDYCWTSGIRDIICRSINCDSRRSIW